MSDFFVPKRFRDGFTDCPSCRQTLYHDTRYCPNYPDEAGPYLKWGGCVCLVHSCFDASQPVQLTLDDELRKVEAAIHYLKGASNV